MDSKIEHNPKARWPSPDPNSDATCTRNEDDPIGKGAERLAVPSTNNRTGKKFVTKIPLNRDDPILTDEATCKYVVATYNSADKLCKAFAAEIPSADSIEFIKASYVEDMNSKPKRFFLHERFINGDTFEKWNNNFGCVNPKAKTSDVQAFAHFVWAYTKGTRMILDLQGIHKDDTDQYFLTDPAYISNTPGGGLCGPTDLGNHAIYNFFSFHDEATCKKMKCGHLPRPDLSKIEKVDLGELLGEQYKKASSTKTLSLKQTFKNSSKAILMNPKAVKQTLKVSQILGMEAEHESYLKTQFGAVARKAPPAVSIPVFDSLSTNLPSLVPNYNKGDNLKTSNPTGLTAEQMKQIDEDW